jgi:hypothetical protein
LGILALIVSPALAGSVTYTFELDPSSSQLIFSAGGVSSSSPFTGAFDVTIYQSDAHIGPSDTFVLSPAALDVQIENSDNIDLLITPGLVELHIATGSFKILDFDTEPDVYHIGEGGAIAPAAQTYLDVLYTFILLGPTGTGTISGWEPSDPNEALVYSGSITTSVSASDTMTMELATHVLITGDVEIDMDIILAGTAHVVPDPTLVGLAAFGLGGAGAWLRRRRMK